MPKPKKPSPNGLLFPSGQKTLRWSSGKWKWHGKKPELLIP